MAGMNDVNEVHAHAPNPAWIMGIHAGVIFII